MLRPWNIPSAVVAFAAGTFTVAVGTVILMCQLALSRAIEAEDRRLERRTRQ